MCNTSTFRYFYIFFPNYIKVPSRFDIVLNFQLKLEIVLWKKKLELLERIRIVTKKTYISDLYKSIDFTCKQARRILLFSLDDYSLEEWTEAVNYISQTRQKFETKEAARDFLYVLILTKAKLYDL